MRLGDMLARLVHRPSQLLKSGPLSAAALRWKLPRSRPGPAHPQASIRQCALIKQGNTCWIRYKHYRGCRVVGVQEVPASDILREQHTAAGAGAAAADGCQAIMATSSNVFAVQCQLTSHLSLRRLLPV